MFLLYWVFGPKIPPYRLEQRKRHLATSRPEPSALSFWAKNTFIGIDFDLQKIFK